MPKKGGNGAPSFRKSSHNAAKPRNGNSSNANNNNSNNKNKKKAGSGLASLGKTNQRKMQKGGGNNRKLVFMREDKTIREQPFEYAVIVHAELAVPDPLQQVEEKRELEMTPTHMREEQAAQVQQQQQQQTKGFDPKQIVQLGFCLLHTPSGTVCGRFYSLVKPPPNAEPLTRYCMDCLGGVVAAPSADLQAAVDSAPALAEVMMAAEKWLGDVIMGKIESGVDAVFDLQEHQQPQQKQKQKQAHDADAEKETNGSDDESDDDDDDDENESGDDAEEKSSDDESGNDDDEAADAAATAHRMILAADGVPTIAAIFQGQQQFMQPAAASDSAPSTSSSASSGSSAFSYLNHLSGGLFNSWIDTRESFHRYFRVQNNMRLKFSDQLREIGLSYSGRGRHAADKAKNIAHLMVAMMKKGCVFSFPLQCRAKHEQAKVSSGVGQASTVIVGDGAAAVSAADSTEAKPHHKQQQQPHHPQKRTKYDVTTFMANTADVFEMRQSGGGNSKSDTIPMVGSPLRGNRAGGLTVVVASILTSQVFLRWLGFLFLLGGILWNVVRRRNALLAIVGFGAGGNAAQ